MPFARSMMARRPKAPSQVVILVEATERDLERALQLLGVAVDQIGEDAAPRRLIDERRVLAREQGDHRAARLAHDALDQLERMLRALAEAHQRDIGMQPRGQRPDVGDVGRCRDDPVLERLDDGRNEPHVILALVREQDAQGVEGFRRQAPSLDDPVSFATNVRMR